MGVPLVVGLVGTAISAGGQIISGIQQSKAAEYSAKVYETEAVTQKQAAEYEEKRHRESVRRFIGIQRAKYAASGVDTGAGGSVKAVLADTAAQGELDALAIRYGGDVATIQAKNRAKLARFEGKSAFSSGLFGAGATLLSGAGQAYSTSLKLKSA